MWYVITFIAGAVCGVACLLAWVLCAVASMADEAEAALRGKMPESED